MKKTVSFLLLIILVLQIGGILLFYKTQQWCIQKQAQHTLKSNETLFQKITLSPLKYRESRINATEISYKGKMYDVRSVIISDTLVELLVFNDRSEENILEKIDEYIKRTVDLNSDFPGQLQQFLTMNYLFTSNEHIFLTFSLPITFFHFLCLNITSHDTDISTPPPRTI